MVNDGTQVAKQFFSPECRLNRWGLAQPKQLILTCILLLILTILASVFWNKILRPDIFGAELNAQSFRIDQEVLQLMQQKLLNIKPPASDATTVTNPAKKSSTAGPIKTSSVESIKLHKIPDNRGFVEVHRFKRSKNPYVVKTMHHTKNVLPIKFPTTNLIDDNTEALNEKIQWQSQLQKLFRFEGDDWIDNLNKYNDVRVIVIPNNVSRNDIARLKREMKVQGSDVVSINEKDFQLSLGKDRTVPWKPIIANQRKNRNAIQQLIDARELAVLKDALSQSDQAHVSLLQQKIVAKILQSLQKPKYEKFRIQLRNKVIHEIASKIRSSGKMIL